MINAKYIGVVEVNLDIGEENIYYDFFKLRDTIQEALFMQMRDAVRNGDINRIVTQALKKEFSSRCKKVEIKATQQFADLRREVNMEEKNE